VLCGVLACAVCAGCDDTPGSVTAYLDGLSSQNQITGAVRVEKDGVVLVEAGYGLADEAHAIANTPATRFRIGSNTKQFTAMAILLLQDDGQLGVDDPICRYLINCPDSWQPITIQELLDHSSGIPDYINSAGFPSYIGTPATVDQLIARFRDWPLDFTPGSQWSYSNSGYLLLGAIVTHVSGLAYADFLRQRIFTPLQMADTDYDVDVPPLGTHATGYLGPGVEPVFLAMSEFDAAGALASTVGDLSRWNQALEQGTIGSAAARAAMFTPHIACPSGGCALGSDIGYGDGWFIANVDGARYDYHWGRIDGFKSSNGFYPDAHVTVILLSNLETVDTFGIASELGTVARKQ
jgi:CubicO group peptidase (beta-lactamase class C family)